MVATDFLGALAGFVGRIYARVFEKPVRVCGEVAAVTGLCAAIWSGYTGWADRPARDFLKNNGYNTDSTGVILAISRHDKIALDRFRELGVDFPSSAVLCSEYRNISDLIFLLENELIKNETKCGSFTDKNIDNNAVKDLCDPGSAICSIDSEENLSKVRSLSRICRSMECPNLIAMDGRVKEIFGSSLSEPVQKIASDKDGFIKKCLGEGPSLASKNREVERWFPSDPAPRRRLYDYDQRPLHRDEMERCTGTPVYPGTMMLDYPDRPYGVGYCVGIDEEERLAICEQNWLLAKRHVSEAVNVFRRWNDARGNDRN
jgi:hypothetical protein